MLPLALNLMLAGLSFCILMLVGGFTYWGAARRNDPAWPLGVMLAIGMLGTLIMTFVTFSAFDRHNTVSEPQTMVITSMTITIGTTDQPQCTIYYRSNDSSGRVSAIDGQALLGNDCQTLRPGDEVVVRRVFGDMGTLDSHLEVISVNRRH